MIRAAAALAVILAASAAPVAADPYRQGEGAFRRDGFAVGFALGPAVFVGGGELDDIQGVGGDLNLRVGTTASDRMLWLLELQAGGYVVEVNREGQKDTTNNNHSTLTVGAQLYLREVLWLRGGLGVATVAEKQGDMVEEVVRKSGLAGVIGGGVDVFRRGVFAMDVELVITGAMFDGAAVGHSALMLGLMWY
jgi:hypothetical protein